MNETKNLVAKNAIEKLKSMVEEINICLFCTNLKTNDGATARPMGAQKVDDEGNIWFFSEKDSDKNKEIEESKEVQLFFCHPGKSSFLVVNGDADILFDKDKTEELWTPLMKTWFKEGKQDPHISIVKVKTTSAYYWDTEGNKMVNFFKMLASVASGTNLLTSSKGNLNI